MQSIDLIQIFPVLFVPISVWLCVYLLLCNFIMFQVSTTIVKIHNSIITTRILNIVPLHYTSISSTFTSLSSLTLDNHWSVLHLYNLVISRMCYINGPSIFMVILVCWHLRLLFYYFFCFLFLVPLFTSCGLLEQFLELHLDSLIVFLSVSLCIDTKFS